MIVSLQTNKQPFAKSSHLEIGKETNGKAAPIVGKTRAEWAVVGGQQSVIFPKPCYIISIEWKTWVEIPQHRDGVIVQAARTPLRYYLSPSIPTGMRKTAQTRSSFGSNPNWETNKKAVIFKKFVMEKEKQPMVTNGNL